MDDPTFVLGHVAGRLDAIVETQAVHGKKLDTISTELAELRGARRAGRRKRALITTAIATVVAAFVQGVAPYVKAALGH